LRLRLFCVAAYLVFFMMSGFLKDPLAAMLIAFVYETGFIGLAMFYKSAFLPNAAMRWSYLGLGALLILLAWIWLEVLSGIIPFGFLQ
jgi:hypothetical protein